MPPRASVAEVSPALSAVIMQALSKDREQRPRTALDFLALLEQCLTFTGMEPRDRVPEGEALRLLARQMAAVSDTAELLAILCEAASAQCNASGSAVVKADDETGQIVAACGMLAPALGKQFRCAARSFATCCGRTTSSASMISRRRRGR